jgi:copper oxidase (laccase) domain-containing protein
VKVADEGRCTVEDKNLYSYRRDGVTGRQVGVVWL